jgi:hypothetical protein
LPDAATFHCTRCGRTLKVPAQLRPQGGGRPRAAAPADGTNVTPAPPRPPAEPAPVAPPARRRREDDGTGSHKVMWPLRLLAWLIALPVGLVAVVVPARRIGFLSGQRLLDVVVTTGWSRYWRVLAIAPAWALVTTLLVQLMLFGMRKLGDRRRAIKAERERAAPDALAAASSRPGGSRRRSARLQ